MVAAGSLITSLGGAGLEAGVVLAMLAGGMLAAPLAAYVVRFVPPRPLGLAVAGLLLLTQTRELATCARRWARAAGSRTAYPVALLIAAYRPRVAASRTERGAEPRKSSLSRKPLLS